MIQHTNAVKARIQAVPAVASKTFVSIAPRSAAGALPAAPYVVIHPADGVDSQERFTGPRSTEHPRFTLHIVGVSYDQVATLTKQIKAQFIAAGSGVVLTIPGEVCKPCWWESPMPVQIDDDVQPPLAYQVIELGFTAETST